MSAKDTSQRSSFSCSSASWLPPILLAARRRHGYAAAFSAGRAAGLVALARALGGRDERDQLLLDDARVVAGLDREDALDDQRAGVQLLVGELLQARGDRQVDDVRRGDAESAWR